MIPDIYFYSSFFLTDSILDISFWDNFDLFTVENIINNH